VTGSAHCSLGPYFGNLLSKSVVIGRQESDRGGLVECMLKKDEGRVCIVGTAVMTVSGKLSMKMC
jgi:predicted PhzF superfamily epimerase YddE/YHI9